MEIGYSRMNNSNIAICSIVRDCKKNLKANIPVINKLKDCFHKSYIVVVENDSKDGTKEVLFNWSKTISNVHIISEDIGFNTMPESYGEVRPWFSCYRIELMARHRNKYLEFLEKSNWELDYIIIVDLDLARISIDGIANSFGQDIRWDAITSNGKGIRMSGYIYRDTYAFKEVGDDSPQTEETIFTYQKLLSGLYIGMPLIRVFSGFSGLAIYTAESISGLRYRCEPNDDINVEAKCEHITFHQDMLNKGYEHIFLNTSQIVYYDNLHSIMDVLSGRMMDIFRQKRR